MLSIFLDVELRNGLAIDQYISGKRLVESFNELDTAKRQRVRKGYISKQASLHCTLTAATGSNKSDICAGLHRYAEAPKHTNARACGITEVNIFEPNLAVDIL